MKLTTTREIVRRTPGPDLPDLPADLHPTLKRIYATRDVRAPQELDCSLKHLIDSARLSGLDAAVTLLQDVIEQEQRILIVADFDADGATSCTLMLQALQAMGATQVTYLVPNRFEYGYGLTPEIVAVAAQQSPELLITVDNGISSVAGVDAANACGMRVLITDHHLPGSELPAAAAIVNPNLPDDDFPSKHLAGVGVAFYVMAALRARLRASGWFDARGIAEPNLAESLDLVALGTVADVVPLDHNNRILVDQGLRRIRAARCRPGILALLQCGGREVSRVVATDLAFAAGPRLNAAGRLEDMSLGIECLLSSDATHAMGLARELDELNKARRNIEAEMKAQAMTILQDIHLDDSRELPMGLCLFDARWHQGVIGIIAGRIKEQLHRPVIVFACEDDDNLKGSARSIQEVHIRDVLDAVATRHAGLVSRFGGHAMAAGLSLPRNRLADFEAAFDAEVRRVLGDTPPGDIIYSDGELGDQELQLAFAEQLRAGGPWGQGFPEPVFDGEFVIDERRVVGQSHLKLTVRPAGGGVALDAIAFSQALEPWMEPATRVRLAYRLDVNEFRGRRSAQLLVIHMEPA